MNKSVSIWIKLMNFGKRLGCHQMPSRSFFVKGYQFPVCARCTGVIVGELLAIILILFSFSIRWWMMLLLLVPMGVDWLLQYINILESTNTRRVITGLLGGIGLTYFYCLLIKIIINLFLL